MAGPPVSLPTTPGDSGSSTNPNTPRQEDCLSQAAIQAPSPLHSLQSKDSDVLNPSPPVHVPFETIRLTYTPARALWQPDGRAEKLYLDIHWVPHGSETGAFFKIHTRIQSDGANSLRRDGDVSVYMLIPPERIHRLSYDTQPDHKPFGPNTAALTFDMARPPALVVPKTSFFLLPKAEHPAEPLYTLSAQPSFVVYVNIPERKLAPTLLLQLCNVVSNHEIASLERVGFRLVGTLYQGRGGHVLDEGRAAISAERENARPPFYDDTDLEPPPAFTGKFWRGPRNAHAEMPTAPGHEYEASSPRPEITDAIAQMKRKRARASSSVSAGEPATQMMDRASLEALLDTRFRAHKLEVRELHVAHEAKILELLSSHRAKTRKLLSDLEARIADKTGSSEERVRDHVVDGISDVVHEKVWEMADEVREDIMDSITSMRLQAVLAFPDHPLY